MSAAAIAGAIGTIALQIGLPELIDFADKAIADKSGTSYTALSNNLNKILQNAKTKLGPKYEELVNRLSNIPGLSGSSAFDQVIRNAKRDLNKDIQRISKISSQVNNMASNLEQQMTQFSYLPSSYKTSRQGKQEMKKILDQGRQLDKLVEQTMKRSQ